MTPPFLSACEPDRRFVSKLGAGPAPVSLSRASFGVA